MLSFSLSTNKSLSICLQDYCGTNRYDADAVYLRYRKSLEKIPFKKRLLIQKVCKKQKALH